MSPWPVSTWPVSTWLGAMRTGAAAQAAESKAAAVAAAAAAKGSAAREAVAEQAATEKGKGAAAWAQVRTVVEGSLLLRSHESRSDLLGAVASAVDLTVLEDLAPLVVGERVQV